MQQRIRENIGKWLRFFGEHKKSVLVFAVFLLLAAGVYRSGQTEILGTLGTASRAGEGGSTETQTFTYQIEGGQEGELSLDVSPQERSADAVLELLQEAVVEFEEVWLGENESADEVRSDLNLPSTLCGGLVEVSYESSNYSALNTDGTVDSDTVEDGELVELTASFSYSDTTQIETYAVLLYGPEEGSSAWIAARLQVLAEEAEENSRQESSFSLPDSVEGYAVSWVAEQNYQWVILLLIGIAAVFCLEQREKEEEKKRIQRRNEQLLLEYPRLVDQFATLLGSGMTIRRAWERMLQTDRSIQPAGGKSRIYIEEMWITFREMEEGKGEREAYEQFGSRIGLLPYRRFASLLSQNLSKGTRDLKELLQREAQEALEMRKNHARRLGEEAGTKMLFPMMIMLVLILAVLMLPALLQM